MHQLVRIPLAFAMALVSPGLLKADQGNPQIDYQAFANQVVSLGKVRAERRVSETKFMQMADDPATVILDARSKEKFDLLHVKGAKNLSLPDITAAELAKLIPTKDTRVLIYCNNNFENEPEAFPRKNFAASLNLHTFTVLSTYGYTNVYELKPLLDIERTEIPFVGSRARWRESKGLAKQQ